MVLYNPQPSWRYPLFQIQAFLATSFLTLALLTHFLHWLSPTVSVQMILDLSSSTYGNVFRGSGTVIQAEIEAVKAYANQNASASNPNLLSLSGFANQVIPITQNFASNPAEIDKAIEQVVQPAIASQVGGGTNLDLAVEKGLDSLGSQSPRCKELLVITDGEAQLNPKQLARAKLNKVRLNFLIVGQPVPGNLSLAATATDGVALSANTNNISALVGGQFRERFNSNLIFVKLFLGLAGVSLIWMLVRPFDIFLQKQMHLRFDFSSQIAILSAIVGTIQLLLFVGFPFWNGC
jgi:Ca-activated chloride channel homolog